MPPRTCPLIRPCIDYANPHATAIAMNNASIPTLAGIDAKRPRGVPDIVLHGQSLHDELEFLPCRRRNIDPWTLYLYELTTPHGGDAFDCENGPFHDDAS